MKKLFILGIVFLFVPSLFLVAQEEVRKVAILETVDKQGDVAYAHKLMLRANLAKAISNAPGYEAYDRTDMDAIMGEQNFQRTGLVSDDQIKRLGEMTGAQFILVAEAVKVDENNMFITAKILNVETAKTEVTDNSLMGSTPTDIQHGCESLANKLLGLNVAATTPIAGNGLATSGNSLSTRKFGKNGNATLNTTAPVTSVASSASKAVGTLKTFNDGTKGVVFFEDASGKGLVVSLDAFNAKWENVSSSRKCHDIQSLPNEEGSKYCTAGLGLNNTNAIISFLGLGQAPAAEWCLAHGEGWYLPSAGELWYLLEVANGKMGSKGALSIAIQQYGGYPLVEEWYWSSTENDNDEAINVSSPSARISSEDKTSELLVRAVRAY